MTFVKLDACGLSRWTLNCLQAAAIGTQRGQLWRQHRDEAAAAALTW
jgi:hypothetical protein